LVIKVTELAENLGVKFAKWDKEDGYFVPRACYNSYFYAVEDTEINVLDKLILHGKEIVGFLDGGSALHFNLEEHLTEEGFMKLYEAAAIAGTNYFTYNVLSTCCDKCGYIDKRTLSACSKCGSTDIDYATRIIGYLKKISSFSEGRRNESDIRYRHPDEFQEKKEVIEPHCKDGVCYF
jgi:ribonucleoside-triphosphate reductase